MSDNAPVYDAIVLAGGRARRLAGADKPAALVGGRRLLDIALAAVADADQVVVVGPERTLPAQVTATREDPPYAGPVAAIAAGTAALSATVPAKPGERPVVVLASDLPEVTGAQVRALLAELHRTGAPAVLAVDDDGRRQYLLGAWRRDALTALARGGPDSSLRALIPAGTGLLRLDGVGDVDTPEELARATSRSLPAQALAPPAARALLRSALTPLSPVTATLADAAGTVLAEPLVAAEPFPPFDASAMDGYAVAGPSPWRLLDTVLAAGAGTSIALRPGQAVTIATGAALPAGAERALRYEETQLSGELLTETSTGRDDTRRTGSAWPAGATLADAGLPVDAPLISVARAAGVHRVRVRGPVRARLHTSGDEIVPDGGDLRPGALPDTASAPVAELLTESGLTVVTAGHLADRREVFARALAAADADLVVIIGATGRGVADHLRGALADAGARLVLDRVALRPGGSLLLAQLPHGVTVLGLGGNPLAAVAGTVVVLPALLDALLARTPRNADVLTLQTEAASARSVHWRVLPVEPDGTGRWSITPGHGTGHLASMLGHRGLALVPPTGAQAPVERLR
ncbi:putative molybdenum cofactor biosynthesis protein [Gordonia hirsuta DSM 44140 = NBRC 16056]|uniref:Molybdopterin molybdenumtransferase n=1 Tax=Gordonia hirsuta DSM 44140 = NBRC 16056 TaxID=1121927 RepID=L7LA19_9ACTN|nr:NTP transferase domain-containing protein [Gordonia hirsuta]GAC57586.1 putative molybdenum cofactor biosynthesis protein [Gordonia hirsuta DSM 44140 = NBRC 16056]